MSADEYNEEQFDADWKVGELAAFNAVPESEKLAWLKARDQRIGDLPDADIELCRGGTSANGVFPYVHIAPLHGGTCRCGAIATGNAKPTSVIRHGAGQAS